ncbi:MAG: PEP-CTERM sorting domain-containing protein [Deltaproteobacteria bacterium]|nr:PEP-CTERM sorting domain-containing protein [Deltaproteobacteria bacterium]
MKVRKIVALFIALAMVVMFSAKNSEAITLTLPDVNFDTVGMPGGGLTYNASSGLLNVNARLVSLTMPWNVVTNPGGYVNYDMVFAGSSSMGGYTTGNFTGGSLTIVDGSSTTLLTGTFISASITGKDGSNLGYGEARFNVTGGSLASSFICGPMGMCGGMVNLAFNLSQNFSSTMFRRDFTGHSKGDIAKVPEPSTLLLLGSGLVGAGLWLRKRAM